MTINDKHLQAGCQVDESALLRPSMPYNLDMTLHSGQAFRWRRVDGWHEGIIKGRLIRLRQLAGGQIQMSAAATQDDILMISDYLAIDEDQEGIEAELASAGGHIMEAVRLSSGLRTLRQEPWETLVSFIISANNGVDNISRIVENLSGLFGDPIEGLLTARRAFPKPYQLLSAGHDGIWACKAGFRTRGICEASEAVITRRIDLDDLASWDYAAAKQELMELRGIGEKVADCILLFSMGKSEAFPVDVWIERIVRLLYFGGRKASHAEIRRWAAESFGKLAGYANQFLFNYGRRFAAEELRDMDRASSRNGA